MKTLLIVAGVLFLLLAVALTIAAIVAYMMSRRRGNELAAPATHPPNPRQTPSTPGTSQDVSLASELPPFDSSYDAKTVLTNPLAAGFLGALHGIAGPLAGRVFPIDAKGFFIGRDPMASQVFIDSPSISKRHVWVGIRDGAVVAIDQRSTNGTFLNNPNTPIIEARLNSGDTLILGGDVARFEYRA